MSRTVRIVEGRETRQVEPAEFPLAVGGAGATFTVPGSHAPDPSAWIGLDENRLFVQSSEGGSGVTCNGAPVFASQWLHDTDVVTVAGTRITVSLGEGEAVFHVEHEAADETTEPPSVVPAVVSPAGSDGEDTGSGVVIQPVEFTPREARQGAGRRRRLPVAFILFWVALVLLGGAAWFLLTSRSVEVEIDPEPDRVAVEGGWFSFRLAGRFVLRPGSYVVVADKAGYHPLEEPVEITRDSSPTLRYTLEKLPGLLVVDNGGVEGIEVIVDGSSYGLTPTGPVELAPGDHAIRLVAERYEDYETVVSIEGGGTTQTLVAGLVPRWAPVTVRSEPAGATIRIDGETAGSTPATVDVLEGRHRLGLTLRGYKPYADSLAVNANEPLVLETVRLAPTDGNLTLRSEPPGATVTVDGVYRGETPIDLELPPGTGHEVRFSEAGYEPVTRRFDVRSDETVEISVTLQPRTGEVSVEADPPDASLYVDGEARGPANQVLVLLAVPHEIEVRRDGYESYRTTVTPRPGFVEALQVTLKTAEQIRAESMPSVIRSPQGQKMVLVDGARLRLGSSRREPGRRANETIREVELERPFYIAAKEVTNREFHEFMRGHHSGKSGVFNLEIADHPVVRVSWDLAAKYCNWLSEKESLPPAYEMRGGRMVAVRPLTTGYRLPTEAEWAYAARYAGDEKPRKYPWGDALPVASGSGNYADRSSEGLLGETVKGYDDRYPVSAPVGSFDPNGLGLFDLGGNVAEWVHDIYTIHPAGSGKVEKDPSGPEEGELHVIRGSSWMDSSVSELRLTYRDYGNEERPDLGFRIARYAE